MYKIGLLGGHGRDDATARGTHDEDSLAGSGAGLVAEAE
jgi:hypothetical protein